MAEHNVSTKILNSFNWIKKVISSVENAHQWINCLKLIQNFENLFDSNSSASQLSVVLRRYHLNYFKTI